MTTSIVGSIRAEYLRYRALGEAAMAQLDDAALTTAPVPTANSIAVLVWHLSGNLASRFTDFLTSDGEKPWRHREGEFAPRPVTRTQLLEKWEHGWAVLLRTLATLDDADLTRTVTIRRQGLLVHEALHRSLAHVAYHVGQIVYLAKTGRGSDWQHLSIPPGQSEAYNAAPRFERPAAHDQVLKAHGSTEPPAA